MNYLAINSSFIFPKLPDISIPRDDDFQGSEYGFIFDPDFVSDLFARNGSLYCPPSSSMSPSQKSFDTTSFRMSTEV